MELITVFTPTYNRKDLLKRCYQCLIDQTSYNFKWLIIDDGSSDNTEKEVKKWIKEEKRFKIDYVYKENGGLYTTYNTAIPLMDTELCICYESDDFFPEDSIEIIERFWPELHNSEYVGLMTMCKDTEGNYIGNTFPDDIKSMYLYERFLRYDCGGDKMYVYKTDILKKVAPMPEFKGEKNFNPLYLMYKADEYGELLVSNEVLCICDYQPGGMTDTVLWQYYNSPNSFAEWRKQHMMFPGAPKKYIFKENIHYVSSCCLAGKLGKAVKESPKKGYTVLALFPGILLSWWIRYKNRDKEK